MTAGQVHWRDAILHLISDEYIKGWVALVPADIVALQASLCCLFGAFLLLALLFFLLCPQSVLELEVAKQVVPPPSCVILGRDCAIL